MYTKESDMYMRRTVVLIPKNGYALTLEDVTFTGKYGVQMFSKYAILGDEVKDTALVFGFEATEDDIVAALKSHGFDINSRIYVLGDGDIVLTHPDGQDVWYCFEQDTEAYIDVVDDQYEAWRRHHPDLTPDKVMALQEYGIPDAILGLISSCGVK